MSSRYAWLVPALVSAVAGGFWLYGRQDNSTSRAADQISGLATSPPFPSWALTLTAVIFLAGAVVTVAVIFLRRSRWAAEADSARSRCTSCGARVNWMGDHFAPVCAHCGRSQPEGSDP